MKYMEWIRRNYGVPAKRGMKVMFMGKPAVIVAARGVYLRLRIEGRKGIAICHPTWSIEYPK